MMPEFHFKFGGSTAGRTIQCPNWVNLAEQVPNLPSSSSAADAGTLRHKCMEHALNDANYYMEPIRFKNENWTYKDQKVDQDAVNDITRALDALEDLLDKYDVADDYRTEVMASIADDIGGSCDFVGKSQDGKTLVNVDYKFGYHSVSPETPQLKFYTLMLVSDEKTRDWLTGVERFIHAVIQPNDDNDDCQTYEMTLEELDDFETLFLASVDDSESATPTTRAGEYCQFCPAMPVCPIKTGKAMQASRVNDIVLEKLAEYLPIAEELEEWIREVKKLAHQQLEEGVHIRGYKLVNKRATRQWNDPDAVTKLVTLSRSIKKDDAYNQTLKSPAQMEKLCKEKGVDFSKYEPYISSVSSGTTLTREDDPRPKAQNLKALAKLVAAG